MEDKLQEYRDAFGEQFPLMLVQGMDDDDILAEIEGCLFWSSVNLTGNETVLPASRPARLFWSSVNLTGNETGIVCRCGRLLFWSSVNLTGNETYSREFQRQLGFWSSVNLTGNETYEVADIMTALNMKCRRWFEVA